MPHQPPKPRDQAPINYWTPTINTTPITSIPHLHQILQTEYPGLQRNPNYTNWLHDAETHLTLITHLQDQTHLERGDRKRLGEELGITRQKFTAWAQEARKPRLYYEIEKSLSKSGATKKIQKLQQDNNGISSVDDITNRLATYYPMAELSKSKLHKKRLFHCDQYFKALGLLSQGGSYSDIAKELGTIHSQIQRWLDGRRPDLVELARRIPNKNPGSNRKWLPLGMKGNFHPIRLISVPLQISTWSQILEVIDQLEPNLNNQMRSWLNQFGEITQPEAFAYLLGMLVSDADKPRAGFTSTSIDLRLTKQHDWSRTIGEATCYYLGKLGIKAKKGPDRDSYSGPKTCFSWVSENSALLTWMVANCLGLESHERTTFHAIRTEWILIAPRIIRIKFVQGLNDGDGWASVKDQTIGNACEPNIDFVKQLLLTFKIESTDDGRRVRIHKQDSLI